MKFKIKYCLCGVGLFILYLFIKEWDFYAKFTKFESSHPKLIPEKHSQQRKLKSEVTLVLRHTYDTSKYLADTVNSFLANIPNIPVVIVSDNVIARDITYKFSNASGVINLPLKLDLMNLIVDRNIVNYVKTRYLLIVPPGVSSLLENEITTLIKILNKTKSTFIAVPVEKRTFKCLKLELNLLQWTLKYKINRNGSGCDCIQGDHGIFMKTFEMSKLGDPFMLPFPEAFYIQTTSQYMNISPIHSVILKNKQKNIKRTDLVMKNQIQRQLMNKQFKIKKVIRENGVVEWYGCTRNTPRCFGNVINSVPEYLNQGRWTPPCCLKVLRQTVHHVFNVLKEWNVTFWLEGGSLLGAMRMNDIIPWDYDVDVGIYLEDINKCPWIRMVEEKKMEKKVSSVVDKEGFVWEKASIEEGDFYRVQASIHNRLHVDIFPFFSKQGIMTKKTWFTNHPQDMEFPELYLKPLTTIEFAGIQAPAPNNVKEFLELKFGKGCVENPQYPNPKLYPFPNLAKRLVINESYNYELA